MKKLHGGCVRIVIQFILIDWKWGDQNFCTFVKRFWSPTPYHESRYGLLRVYNLAMIIKTASQVHDIDLSVYLRENLVLFSKKGRMPWKHTFWKRFKSIFFFVRPREIYFDQVRGKPSQKLFGCRFWIFVTTWPFFISFGLKIVISRPKNCRKLAQFFSINPKSTKVFHHGFVLTSSKNQISRTRYEKEDRFKVFSEWFFCSILPLLCVILMTPYLVNGKRFRVL